MSWLVKLLGGNALGTVRQMLGMFFGNREAREANDHDESMASHQEFASEFQVLNRTWFDSLIDGINRLPRPAIVCMVIYYFVLAVRSPVDFQILNTALDGVPTFMWQLAMIIVSFYFVAREFQKSREGRLSLTAAQFNEQQRRVAELQAQKKAGESIPAVATPPAMDDATYQSAMADPRPLPNAAIAEWNRRRQQQQAAG